MGLRDEINAGLTQAMKAGDKRRVSTLRLVNSALKNADIEARGHGKPALSDDEILGVLQKMIRQRQESLAIYQQAAREDLATAEREEIDIIGSFLPRPMPDSEVRAAVEAAVRESGAAGMKDMGKVMAALKERHAGQMDFAKASAAVKKQLG
jgi:uncharacterized protein YqeY